MSTECPFRACILTAQKQEADVVHTQLSYPYRWLHCADGSVYGIHQIRTSMLDGASSNQWDVLVTHTMAGNTPVTEKTETAIRTFNPHLVLFVGCAGGRPGAVAEGDIVVGEEVGYYQPGKITKPDQLKMRSMSLTPDRPLIQAARDEGRAGAWRQRLKPTPERTQVHLGKVASGEMVVTDSHSLFWQAVDKHLKDVLAAEIDGYGFAFAQRHTNVPGLVIRGISDLLDNKNPRGNASWLVSGVRQRRATDHAAAFACHLLLNLEPEWIPTPRPVLLPTRGNPLSLQLTLACSAEDEDDVKTILKVIANGPVFTEIPRSPNTLALTMDVALEISALFAAMTRGNVLPRLLGVPVVSVSASSANASEPVFQTVLTAIQDLGDPELGDPRKSDNARTDLRASAQLLPQWRLPIRAILECCCQMEPQTLSVATSLARLALLCGELERPIDASDLAKRALARRATSQLPSITFERLSHLVIVPPPTTECFKVVFECDVGAELDILAMVSFFANDSKVRIAGVKPGSLVITFDGAPETNALIDAMARGQWRPALLGVPIKKIDPVSTDNFSPEFLARLNDIAALHGSQVDAALGKLDARAKSLEPAKDLAAWRLPILGILRCHQFHAEESLSLPASLATLALLCEEEVRIDDACDFARRALNRMTESPLALHPKLAEMVKPLTDLLIKHSPQEDADTLHKLCERWIKFGEPLLVSGIGARTRADTGVPKIAELREAADNAAANAKEAADNAKEAADKAKEAADKAKEAADKAKEAASNAKKAAGNAKKAAKPQRVSADDGVKKANSEAKKASDAAKKASDELETAVSELKRAVAAESKARDIERRDLPAAEAVFCAALTIAACLTSLDKTVTAWQYTHGVVHMRLAATRENAGKPDEAKKDYEHAKAILEQSLAHDTTTDTRKTLDLINERVAALPASPAATPSDELELELAQALS